MRSNQPDLFLFFHFIVPLIELSKTKFKRSCHFIIKCTVMQFKRGHINFLLTFYYVLLQLFLTFFPRFFHRCVMIFYIFFFHFYFLRRSAVKLSKLLKQFMISNITLFGWIIWEPRH